MKHLLNNLSNEEKNRIREQYEGGMSVDNSRFKKLMESKLGNVKPLIMEQENKITGNFNVIPYPSWEKGSGFFGIRINTNDNITSVINKYDGGQTESQKNSLANAEPKDNNTIAATYWFKGTPQTFTINITGTGGSTNLTCTVKDETWNGYAFHFTNLSAGTYTITASNSKTDSLTVTVSEPANCDTEWKTLYDLMEKKADEGSVDIRPYYCSKSQDGFIKQNFPNIDQGKINCLNKKIKQQYC